MLSIMSIEFDPSKIFKAHVALIFILLCANVIGIISKFYWEQDFVYGLVPLLNFDTEKNIPTLFSSMMLVACSALLYFISADNKKNDSPALPWLGLSLIFLFLSIDEISGFHEKLIDPVTAFLGGVPSFLHFSWIIPYSAALIVFIAAYAKFLLGLPRNTMLFFVLSGVTFVAGAVGFEMLGGIQAANVGRDNLLFCVFYTCEEFLEMLGIAIFIYTLLTYIVDRSESLTITVASKNAAR